MCLHCTGTTEARHKGGAKRRQNCFPSPFQILLLSCRNGQICFRKKKRQECLLKGHLRPGQRRSGSEQGPRGPKVGLEQLPHEEPPVPPALTRTLCLGLPIRSKKGREVCGAVLVTINRLEAFGFPVHRYHADRAQQLKSKQLMIWLRDKGIHATWTPGDTPAGSKAEIAVKR